MQTARCSSSLTGTQRDCGGSVRFTCRPACHTCSRPVEAHGDNSSCWVQASPYTRPGTHCVRNALPIICWGLIKSCRGGVPPSPPTPPHSLSHAACPKRLRSASTPSEQCTLPRWGTAPGSEARACANLSTSPRSSAPTSQSTFAPGLRFRARIRAGVRSAPPHKPEHVRTWVRDRVEDGVGYRVRASSGPRRQIIIVPTHGSSASALINVRPTCIYALAPPKHV